MKNSLHNQDTKSHRSNFLGHMAVNDKAWLEQSFGWWFRLTMPSGNGKVDRRVQREVRRRARLLSTVGLFYLAFLLLVFPVSFYTTRMTLYANVFSFVIVICALGANRLGKTRLGGILIVLVFECGLIISILAARPLDLADLPLYDIFIIGELIAVSLLPIRWVGLLTVFNTAFIIGDLIYQPHTPALHEALQTQLILLIARPVCIQLSVLVVLSLWVDNTLKANLRANRAEMLATVEHALAAQHTIAKHEKQELEESIQQLIQVHVDAINKRINARIPYPPAKVLWPLVGVFNALWVRLQHSQENEYELLRLKAAIAEFAEAIQHASLTPQRPLELKHSGTDIDILTLSVKKLHDSSREKSFVASRREVARLNSFDLYQ